MKDVEKLLKLDPKNTELLAQKQKLLTEAIGGSKDRLKELEKAQQELAKKDASPELQKQQDALQREIEETKLKIKGFEDELGKIPNKAKQAFDKVGETLKKTGEKMTEVGDSMTKYVTTPIIGAGTAAVAAFKDVDKGMDTVLKKTGATGEELADMERIVESLATTIPTTFEEAGQAVGEINTRFGVTGDELEDLSSQFIKFAQLNNTTVSDSVDRTQRLMAAYGIETKDTSKVLDVLNRTAQKTGLRVDKLSDLMTNNADSLQKMGMNASDAAEFLGQVEMSGADVSAVMKALQKTNQKAAKQGKTMNQVLLEFSAYMKGNATEAEKTQRAIELFGNKGGQAIYNAAKQGKLSFQSMNTTLEDFAGSVEDTFSGTIDGVDNWKMAMNQAKLIASDIGGILSEFAGPILTKVRDALQQAVGWWRGLNDNQQETILKVMGITAAIGPALSIIGRLTTAVGALSSGLGILAAHPVVAAIVGATTAFGALVLAIKKAGDEGEAYMQEMYGVNSEMQANIDKIEELTKAYEDSQARKEETFKAFDAEYDHLQDLAEEYDTYLDSNGKVIEKYEERAHFIENQLSEALGLEVEEIQAIIAENGKLSDSIDQIIEKRKAEAILNSLTEDYHDAIVNVTDAEDALIKAENDLAEADSEVAKLTKEITRLDKLDREERARTTFATSQYTDELEQLRDQLEYAEQKQKAATQAVEDAGQAYDNYNATIKQYEGLSSAVIEGDTTKIHKSLETFKNDFRTAETATVGTLKKQVEDYKTQYEETKKAVENGSKRVTKADLDEKAYWYKQAQTEYNKATKAAKDAASDAAGGYASQLRNGRPKVESATQYVGGGVTNELQAVKDDAGWYGEKTAEGFANGISRSSSLATYAARNMANAVETQLQQTLQIHSPSKLTEYFGKMLDEGLAIGMQNGLATQAAERLADEVSKPFQNPDTKDTVANAVPMNQSAIVEALSTALSKMKVEMDDREMGQFVERTVVKAVYA